MKRRTLVVTGARGFIGHHFLSAPEMQFDRILALSRNSPPPGHPASVEWVCGELSDPDTWSRLLVPGCTVVNLAYAQTAATSDAINSVKVMVEACAHSKVARLIHCSTVSVYGRTNSACIDELTPCNPLDSYGQQKLAIERALLATVGGRFEYSVLRPAAVFGPGGQGLRTLCESLLEGSTWINYARSCLFGQRRMHLVPVETVVGAVRFLIDVERPVQGEVFIVAADEEAQNNFSAVEDILMDSLGVRAYRLPKMALPAPILSAMLRWRGRSDTDPHCVYRSTKLREWGFRSAAPLEQALRAFALQSRRKLDREACQ